MGLSDHPDPLLRIQGSAGAGVVFLPGAFCQKHTQAVGFDNSSGSAVTEKMVSQHPSDLHNLVIAI